MGTFYHLDPHDNNRHEIPDVFAAGTYRDWEFIGHPVCVNDTLGSHTYTGAGRWVAVRRETTILPITNDKLVFFEPSLNAEKRTLNISNCGPNTTSFGQRAVACAWDGSYVLVIREDNTGGASNADDVIWIDPRSGTVAKTRTIELLKVNEHVAITWMENRLYIFNTVTNLIRVMAAESGSTLVEIKTFAANTGITSLTHNGSMIVGVNPSVNRFYYYDPLTGDNLRTRLTSSTLLDGIGFDGHYYGIQVT